MPHILSIALVLQLQNVAAAPPVIVDQAARELTRVYDDIGVHVEWDRAGDRHEGAGPVVRVILIAREAGVLRRTPHAVMGATIWTDKGTPVVYVFYRPVEAEAERYAVSTALVLACALAHEVGHVLMPDGGHSREGLMRACWNRDDFNSADRGRLRFVPAQAALIRASAGPP